MRRLNFTDSEKAALIAFLKTLTDHKFLTDPKFSDPWR
jgi:cytochrome c peroxidase